MPSPTTSKTSLKSLFFCIFFFSYPFNNEIVSAALVTSLPGFQGPLPFSLETGYIPVDEENGAELFYYFIESEGSPSEGPLLLWLTGGPRCSSLSALAVQNGPLRFVFKTYDGTLPKLVYHPYSWTKVASIIFLDSPVGTGFSYSRNPEGYDVGDISSSKQVHKFLLQWFIDHPRFVKNEFYIGGDSYAGKVVPVVAQEVVLGIEAGINPVINFKGYIIGNPSTGDINDANSQLPYAHGFGIISHEFFQLAQSKCRGQNYRNPSSSDCAICMDTFEKVKSELNAFHILEPKCDSDLTKLKYASKNWRILDEKDYIGMVNPLNIPSVNCRSYPYYLTRFWANNNLTRAALNVKPGTKEKWVRCAKRLPYAYDLSNNIGVQLNLTSRGYRALVYSGDHDMVIPFLGTYSWTRSLGFPTTDGWRSWHVEGQVAGYTTSYSNNLTFATVKGAGHTGPEYKPEECLTMVRRWMSYEPL